MAMGHDLESVDELTVPAVLEAIEFRAAEMKNAMMLLKANAQ